MSSNRSLTKSQARSLLSIARLKIARSRLDPESSSLTRMDQTCFGSSGFFWPISNPLFQGRRLLQVGCTDMGMPPPSRPPRRSTASKSIYSYSAVWSHRTNLRPAGYGANRTYPRGVVAPGVTHAGIVDNRRSAHESMLAACSRASKAADYPRRWLCGNRGVSTRTRSLAGEPNATGDGRRPTTCSRGRS
jgi:hypothetical protein